MWQYQRCGERNPLGYGLFAKRSIYGIRSDGEINGFVGANFAKRCRHGLIAQTKSFWKSYYSDFKVLFNNFFTKYIILEIMLIKLHF
ncbi:MAG: hypothetical protein BAA00_00800 [Parageobacillus thermoglucosidasius]|nr:hypothetical protein GT20_2685 [Parageobacillus thermoglucosidasius TNO-09.020]MBY6269952.1 hypothetical protein [Parageobacillus thermoglucosidasius]OUM91592.1 MAG: hypothetical protein BAA00_00800 [Parageobacillus thermoglucosidasius]